MDHEILRCLHSTGTSLIELKHGNSCFLEFKRNRKLNFCETLFLIWPLQRLNGSMIYITKLAYLYFTTIIINKLFFSMQLEVFDQMRFCRLAV